MLVILTLPFDALQRWSQKCSGCDHAFDISQKWSQIRPLHFYNTFEWFQRWEQICNELLLQTLMSKVILRKEIKKLYLNTVLKIFIRQYRTQAGNHGNCCFIAIFENVLKYLLFEVFFCLILSGSFSPWSINIRCNDSDAKQWLNNWTMEDWSQARQLVFGAKLSRLQTLSARGKPRENDLAHSLLLETQNARWRHVEWRL